jgi:hypothetical protein
MSNTNAGLQSTSIAQSLAINIRQLLTDRSKSEMNRRHGVRIIILALWPRSSPRGDPYVPGRNQAARSAVATGKRAARIGRTPSPVWYWPYARSSRIAEPKRIRSHRGRRRIAASTWSWNLGCAVTASKTTDTVYTVEAAGSGSRTSSDVVRFTEGPLLHTTGR